MEFKIAISKLKMIKRDWILPNLSHFTYTLLYNPFYTVFVVCDILINNKNSMYFCPFDSLNFVLFIFNYLLAFL